MLVLNMEECTCRLRFRLLARRCVGLVRVTAVYDICSYRVISSLEIDIVAGLGDGVRSKVSVFLTSVC